MFLGEEIWKEGVIKAHSKLRKHTQVTWSTIRRLNIEPTTACNASCVMCDHQRYFGTYGLREVCYTDMLHILFQMYKFGKQFGGIKQVNFGVYCEPLLYHDIVHLVKFSKGLFPHVRISTNLSLLTGKVSQQLLQAGLTDICFSLDECEKSRYEAIRRGLCWESVLGNATEFVRRRNSGGFGCNVVVSPVVCKENRGRIKEISEFWRGALGVPVVPSPEVPIGRLVDRVQPWFDSVGKPSCVDMFTVKPNGNVVPCCIDIYGDAILGNIHKQTPQEIYDGELLAQHRYRLAHLVNLPQCCRNCVYLPQFQPKDVSVFDRIVGSGMLLSRRVGQIRGRTRKDECLVQ